MTPFHSSSVIHRHSIAKLVRVVLFICPSVGVTTISYSHFKIAPVFSGENAASQKLFHVQWHSTTSIVPYIYFYGIKLFPVYGNVLYVLIYSVYGECFFSTDANITQKRQFNNRRLDKITIKKLIMSRNHVANREH